MLSRLLPTILVLAIHLLTEAISAPSTSTVGGMAANGRYVIPADAHERTIQKRDDAPVEPPPPKHWEPAKSAEDMEAFRLRHSLTLVSAPLQDAALMPSWPEALIQYILVAPPFNCFPTTTTSSAFTTTAYGVATSQVFDYEISHLKTLYNFLLAVLSHFIFVAWCALFGIAQNQRETGGWMSVLGWAA